MVYRKRMKKQTEDATNSALEDAKDLDQYVSEVEPLREEVVIEIEPETPDLRVSFEDFKEQEPEQEPEATKEPVRHKVTKKFPRNVPKFSRRLS